MSHRSARTLLLAAFLAGGGWGCGSSGAGGISGLIPVKGKVTFKGRPVTRGLVTFEPDGPGRPATGRLKQDGTFILSTLKEGDGAVAGHHRVSVEDPVRSRKGGIPGKYASANTSQLEVDVDAEHTEFTFDLE